VAEFDQFKTGAAAGGDVGKFVFEVKLVDGGNRVSPAYDRGGF
jgi:hypothetical protein